VTKAEASQLARRRWLDIKESRIEDYLFIGGPRLTSRAAAERLGVTKRTIERYKAELRGSGRLA
jgi:hypothetical protein